MRVKILFLVLVLVLNVLVVNAQENQIDLSGEWILDKENSDLPEGRGGRRGGMVATKMIVQHEENLLTVEGFRQNRDGEEVSIQFKYTLDGEECENASNFGTQVSTAEWSSDDELLTISSTMTISRGEREFSIESVADWFMDDGVLIIETTRSTPMGEMVTRALYTKKE